VFDNPWSDVIYRHYGMGRIVCQLNLGSRINTINSSLTAFSLTGEL
jgi:hypothetical protein